MFGILNLCVCIFGVSNLQKVSAFDDEYSRNDITDLIQIKLDSGILQGNLKRLKDGQSYYNFQGIPFALPPLGNLRFKDPVAYKGWNGVLNATSPGPSCVEIMLRQITYSVSGKEDCLYLNVYTSQNPHTAQKLLPVMVWIYGGSFREGKADLYGPDYLMNENVVLVTFNYRLGVFGFLSTQDENAPGNYGMKDILMALNWVKMNIEKFGGDPNKITISGESAGGAAVGYLLMSNQSKNLFNAAIMQSGTPLCIWALHRNARKVAFDLGISLGITTNSSSDLVRYLRGIDLAKARQSMINVNLLNFAGSFNNGGPFGPVMEPNGDNAFITRGSYKAFKNGDFHKVPILMGLNSQESKFFNSLLVLTRPLLFLYDVSPSSLVRTSMNIKSVKDRPIVGSNIKKFYFKSRSVFEGTDAELAEFFSDDLFVRPIIKTAQLLSRHVPVYFYVYDFEGPTGKAWIDFASEQNKNVKGVGHGTELWYLWKATWTKLQLTTKDERLASQRLVRLWTNFMKFGNPIPRTEGLFNNLTWPTATSTDVEYFYIGKDVKVGKNWKERSMRFWGNLYANYSKGPLDTY